MNDILLPSRIVNVSEMNKKRTNISKLHCSSGESSASPFYVTLFLTSVVVVKTENCPVVFCA